MALTLLLPTLKWKTVITYFTLFLLSSTAIFCNQDTSKIKFYPLHPYSASPTDYDPTQKKSRTFITKYYFIEGAAKASDELSNKVDLFLSNTILNDSINFREYGGYTVLVFKESNFINKDYRNRGTDDSPDSHMDDDLLFEYQWNDRQFSKCEFYKNGTITKTIRKKPALIFK